MQEIPLKPYLVRALYEWCVENGYTPHLVVQVDENTAVPSAYIQDGRISLDIGSLATNQLLMENTHITFQARFNGILEHIYVPMSAVAALYARETGVGMGFETLTPQHTAQAAAPKPVTPPPDNPPLPPGGSPRKPKLTLVK